MAKRKIRATTTKRRLNLIELMKRTKIKNNSKINSCI